MAASDYRAFLNAAFDGPWPAEAVETLAEMERSEAEARRRRELERTERE